MKLKSYLRGVGIGIIITTLILTVANNVRMANYKDEPITTTVPPIISYNKETQAKENESIEDTTEQQETKTQTPTQETTQEPTQETVEEPTKASNEEASITVVLQNIISSEKAAQAIQQAGVIDDWRDFNSYLVTKGYATRIHDGTYTLTKGQDYDSIARIITSR